jgi:uncharacterized protein DUF6600
MRVPIRTLLALLLVAAPAYAQKPAPAAPDQPPATDNAPPARVGRVAFVAGNVALYQLGQTDWTKAAVNLPVASGDWVATDPQGRAELRIGPDSFDLANNTELNFADLRDNVMQVALVQGRIDAHLRQLNKGESNEIDIPAGGVWLLEPGIYDIAVGTGAEPTRISVFEGSARFAGGKIDKTIKAGDVLVLTGTGDKLAATVERAAPDDFTKWCRSRDYDQQKLGAPYHVSPRMTGYEELDQYGRWQSVAQYGEVWYPSSVPVGWTPYRDGYWDWGGPWGYTWVDYEPWGFAPSHYGRWAYTDGLWGWVPGGYIDRPVYAPALVGWIGDPNAVLAVGLSGPAVGWFPLGPGEAYYPGYTGNLGYVRALNAGVVPNAATLAVAAAGGAAAQQFANRRFATVVPQQAFTSGTPAARAALAVSDPAVQRAAVAARPNAPQPTVAAAGSRAAARNPGAPNFSRLSGPVGRTAQAPPGEPNFARLGTRGGSGAASGAGNAAQAEAAHGGHAEHLGAAAAGAVTGAAGARIAERHAAARAAGPGRFAAAHAGRGLAGRRMAAAPHFGGHHVAAGPRFGGPHMAGPRMARMAGPHFAAPRMGGPHMGGPRGGGPAGGGHGGGGGPPGGGGPHGGGGGHGGKH